MKQRKHIYLVNTGGTIGMERGRRGYRPAPGFLARQMAVMPELSRPEMPRYTLVESPTLLDSSNMTPRDWGRIARELMAQYDACDGFVVMHGTDTMAFTASALSYMFEGLRKPILLTGSQIPLVEVRSDARDNLITSMLIAAQGSVPEVCIYFGERLLRGNRASKVSADGFRAFSSPNYPPLGTTGVEIDIDTSLVLPPAGDEVKLYEMGDPQVADIRVFPGISAATIRRFLQPPLVGAVLHTYGVGNAPSDPEILTTLRAATERGVVVVNCTQCLRGSVKMEDYVTGNALREVGVISGYDMTPEAALTKLYYLLSRNLPIDEVKNLMQQSLRGELTRP